MIKITELADKLMKVPLIGTKFVEEIGEDEQCTGVRILMRRDDHPTITDRHWFRWIIFMYITSGHDSGVYAHYGENISHARTGYPERINDDADVKLALKYFTDAPGALVVNIGCGEGGCFTE
jgi:hypothetical protein